MAKEETQTSYEVRSAVTGATVCGPYDSKQDADREQKRLTKEAATGRTENGVELTRDQQPIRHGGQVMRYEVVTVEGVILAGD